MNGAFAIPGPPVILYVVATISDPVKSRAFLMMFFWCSSMVSLVMFGVAGLITPRPFQLLWVALPAMWLGNRIGDWGFRKVRGSGLSPLCGGALHPHRPDYFCKGAVLELTIASHCHEQCAPFVSASRGLFQSLACRATSYPVPSRCVP